MNRDPVLIERARELRRALTPADRILCKRLRDRRFRQWKFRRQRRSAPFILDCYCAALKLCIEIDGETHLGREEADGEREERLESQGIVVLRFWNNQVFDELDAVLEAIWTACK